MANFFDYLPDVYYGVEVSKTYLEENSMEYVLGKNFFRSARIRDDFAQYATLFTPYYICLLYTSPSPRDMRRSRMPSSA